MIKLRGIIVTSVTTSPSKYIQDSPFYWCDQKRSIYRIKASLKSHFQNIHGPESEKVRQVRPTFKVPCEICGISIKKYLQKRHMKHCHSEVKTKFKCTLCDYTST